LTSAETTRSNPFSFKDNRKSHVGVRDCKHVDNAISNATTTHLAKAENDIYSISSPLLPNVWVKNRCFSHESLADQGIYGS
jgi:hypothetical protein